jgi:hypothetical protein
MAGQYLMSHQYHLVFYALLYSDNTYKWSPAHAYQRYQQHGLYPSVCDHVPRVAVYQSWHGDRI